MNFNREKICHTFVYEKEEFVMHIILQSKKTLKKLSNIGQ